MAERRRFFVPKIEGATAELTGEEFVHAHSVLRLDVGAEVVLLDNSGLEYDAVVVRVDRRGMLLNILGSHVGEREAKTEVRLFFGFLKNADRNEFVVQKATELGVREIGVFASEYSSAFISENKLGRLRRVAAEAAKQCLRSCAPSVVSYATLQEALAAGAVCKNRIFACEFLRESQTDLRALEGSCSLIVGSEGGFSRGEFEMAQSAGYKGITLGKRILRAETAAVALTSAVMFCLNEWQ